MIKTIWHKNDHLPLRCYSTNNNQSDALLDKDTNQELAGHFNERFLNVNQFKITKKDLSFAIHIDIEKIIDLNDKDHFKNQILRHPFKYGNTYIVLIKIRSVSGNYYTITKKQLFIVPTPDNEYYIDRLWNQMIDAIDYNLDYYLKVIEDDASFVTLEFHGVDELNKVRIVDYPTNLENISDNKDNIRKEFDIFGSPTSVDMHLYDYTNNFIGGDVRFLLEYNKGKLEIDNIPELLDFDLNNFKKSFYSGNYDTVKFYLHILNNRYYVIAVYMIKENNHIIYFRQAFNKYGQLIREIKDTYMEDIIVRSNNNIEYIIDHSNDITKISWKMTFNSIKSNIKRTVYIVPNNEFGTLDLETYVVNDGSKSDLRQCTKTNAVKNHSLIKINYSINWNYLYYLLYL